jgi:pyrimidine oxygenase
VQLESVTLMAGLAAVTSRAKLWATIHPMLQNPAVAAKMIATLDHMSGGRAGLNIVAGAFRAEFEQMGAWDERLDHDERYALAEEWTHVVKRLWDEASVTHHGRYFDLQACESNPKPLSKPRPDLICAGMSERGFQFAVREADACFVGGWTAADRRAASRKAREMAAGFGKQVKTYAMCTLVYAETDAKAEAMAERYREGVDMGAVIEMLKNWGVPPEKLDGAARQQGAFMTHTAIGSPATCAAKLEDFLAGCELDGVMLIFPDYVEGLKMFGADILPGLRMATA